MLANGHLKPVPFWIFWARWQVGRALLWLSIAAMAGMDWLARREFKSPLIAWLYPALFLGALAWSFFKSREVIRQAYRRRFRLMVDKASRFSFGDGVRVEGSEIWDSGGLGTIGQPPSKVTDQTGRWFHDVALAGAGQSIYWVYFDDPLKNLKTGEACGAGAVEGWALSAMLRDDPLFVASSCDTEAEEGAKGPRPPLH